MNPPADLAALKESLVTLAAARGFDTLGVSDVALEVAAAHLDRWLSVGRHGEMDYMSKHGSRRTRQILVAIPSVALGMACACWVLGQPGDIYASAILGMAGVATVGIVIQVAASLSDLFTRSPV